jgi:hypothetical protein
MAKLFDIDEAAWAEWLSDRPPEIKAMAAKWPPNRLYRMTDTGQRCTLCSYAEDGTVRVSVTGEHNFTPFDREVFGVDPSKLVECDLPASDEPIGTFLNAEEQEEFIGLQIAELHHAGKRHNEGACPVCSYASAGDKS